MACTVDFDGPSDFLRCYQASLAVGVWYIPVDAGAELAQEVDVHLHLPIVKQDLQLRGGLVLGRSGKVVLSLPNTGRGAWGAISAYHSLCGSILREIRSLPQPEQGGGVPVNLPSLLTSADSFWVAFDSILAFMNSWHRDMCLGGLVVATRVALPTSRPFSISMRAPPGHNVLRFDAQLRRREGATVVLDIIPGPEIISCLAARAGICMRLWGELARSLPGEPGTSPSSPLASSSYSVG